MKRHLNYTARKKIPAKNVQIHLHREDGSLKSFNAAVNLTGIELPFDAKVFIEAYYRTDRKRFDFGTVSNIVQPESTDLSDLGNLENLNFRIKIVDQTTRYGLILAEADKIRPHSEGDETDQIRAILATEFNCDLGHQIWRINYAAESPIIEFNKNIPNIRSLAKSDPVFFFHVYPQVVREVLYHLFFVEKFDPEDVVEDWHKNWYNFAKSIYPESTPGKLTPTTPETYQDIIEWIDDVVHEFCLSENRKWDRFLKIVDKGISE